MKKLIMAIVAVTTIAQADISVNYFTAYGFTDVSNGADALFLDTGETALVQLINAGANATADAVTDAGAGMFGDDTLISSFTYTASATPVADFTGYAYEAARSVTSSGISGGANIFARIYQDSTAGVGSLYYDGAVVFAVDANPPAGTPPAPTSYNFGGNTGTDVADFASVIPEPATIGLLGIAAAGLFTARRKVRV
jgi:hypothetical protein